jgi:hypothetical protein
LPLICSSAQSFQKTPGEGVFEDLHHHRGIAALGFAEQQMSVLGHDDVANDHETVTPAHLFHHFEKQITILWGAEQGSSLIAAGGNEVKISGAVVAVQFRRHRATSITELRDLSVPSEQGD